MQTRGKMIIRQKGDRETPQRRWNKSKRGTRTPQSSTDPEVYMCQGQDDVAAHAAWKMVVRKVQPRGESEMKRSRRRRE
jgi:hypothetical protein